MSQSAGQHPSSNLSTASAPGDMPVDVTWPPDLSGDRLAADTVIGNYRIIDQLGAGGMGIVYKAEQLRPVTRIVALKLIKLGMDTREVVARFQSERQALAMLEHPGIARVYDAGATDTGRPYFVMELVDGVPITQYCDEHKLTTQRRLELFADVCHAVQYAHYKGILHRDLKPSNILVAQVDGKPQPKVIDFGIAKAITGASGGTNVPMATLAGQPVGTPMYMSPEQAAGQDIDTRSDVYSLGIVLYQLLSGALPFDPDSYRGVDSIQIARRLLDTDPPRPSTRVTLAGSRGSDATLLRRQLRGDVDRIVMKAIDKDRSQRYGTPAALAEDVRRHLAHEPISARPPTLAYQARKFARRNRVAVLAGGIVMLAVICGGITAGIGLVRARQALAREAQARVDEQSQRQVAQNVSKFLGDMLASVDPRTAKGDTVLVRDVLDRSAAELDSRFATQPLVAAELHTIVSNTYHGLGMLEPSRSHAQSALDLRREHQGQDHPESIEAQNNLANMLRALKRNREAEVILRDVVERSRRINGPDEFTTLVAEETLSLVLRDTDRADEAEPLARHSFETRRRIFGEDHAHTLLSLHNMAAIAEARGRMDESISLYRSAAEARERRLGADHPSTILSWNNLAAVMLRQKRFADAEPILRDMLARSERVQGKDHPHTLACVNNLASALQLQGKLEASENLFRELVARVQRTLPENHPNTLLSIGHLAEVLEFQNKADEALAMYADLYKRSLAAEMVPSQVADYCKPYGLCLVKFGRYQQAEAPLLESMRLLQKANRSKSKSMRDVLAALALVHEQTGRPVEAAEFRAQAASLSQPGIMPATGPSR